ncbi:MAG: DnaJ family molecular chaperone [Pseudomonadota bacterium]
MAEKGSIWERIVELLSHLNPLAALERHPDPRHTTTFTIAVIALAAKIAKADGQVTRDEVTTFREIFLIRPEDEARVAQVYNLLRQDAAHFEVYARQLRRLFEHDRSVLKDVLDALFAIAMADGEFHPNEEAFLESVAAIFEVDAQCYAEMIARWVPDRWNPWEVLGVSPGATDVEIRARYRELVRASHPDQLIAKGLPEEMVALATRRVADINRAYDALRARKPEGAASSAE